MIIYHPRLQKDLRQILSYYEEESGTELADRFFAEFLSLASKAEKEPKLFHPANHTLRRATVPRFPYHFLFRETDYGIRIIVLKHDRRHPSYGLRRK